MNEQLLSLQIQYLLENHNEQEILDERLKYLENCYADKIKAIRGITGHNPHFTFADEAKIIEYLYARLLQDRKEWKGRELFMRTSGWTVQYIRKNVKYKKGEKFHIRIYHSFVQTDNFR
jgi:hypothetical protein